MIQPATACIGSPSVKSVSPLKYGVSVVARAVTVRPAIAASGSGCDDRHSYGPPEDLRRGRHIDGVPGDRQVVPALPGEFQLDTAVEHEHKRNAGEPPERVRVPTGPAGRRSLANKR